MLDPCPPRNGPEIVEHVAAESDAELADIADGLRLLDEAGRRVLDSERASL